MFHEVAPAMPFFLPQGRVRLQRARSSTCATSTSASGYEEVITPQVFDKEPLPHQRPPRQLQREHVPSLDRGPVLEELAADLPTRSTEPASSSQAERVRAQADELPEPLRHLRHAPPQLPRAALARGGLRRACTATSAAAWSTAWRACAASARTTRTSSAPRIRSRRDRALHRASSTASTRRSASTRSTSSSRPAPRSASAPTTCGTRPRSALADGLEQVGARRTRCRPARAPSTAPRSSSTCRTRSSAAGSSARSSSTPTCRERFDLEYTGAGRRRAPAGHAPPRDLRLARALLRHLPRALRRQLPGVARARAGRRPHRQREERRLRARRVVDRLAAKGLRARRRLQRATSSAPRSATPAWRATPTCSWSARRRPRPTASGCGPATPASWAS